MSLLSRRTVLTGAAAAVATSLRGVPAAAQAPLRFSTIAVDVGPLRALGLGPFAEIIRSAMAEEMRSVFAERVGGPGPRLVVRVLAVSLQAYVGGGGGGSSPSQGGGQSNDYMEGEALVVGARGEVIARYPQLLALPSSHGGAWYAPDNERRRAVILSRYFAQWLRRTVA